MTDFKSAKMQLTTAIGIWRRAWEVASMGMTASPSVGSAWQAVEDAILALDNAAYSRAAEKVLGELLEVRKDRNYRQRCAEDWHQTATSRFQEIEHLTTERDAARADATTMTLANDDKRQLLRRMQRDLEDDRAHREHVEAERDADRDYANRARAEVKDARDEIARVRPTIQQAQDRLDEARVALDRERNAAVLLRRESDELERQFEERGVERDRLRHTLSDLENVLWRRGYRDGEADRLRAALETLADRYHAQLCYRNRRSQHSRHGCPHVSAVQDANAALAGESESARFSGKISKVASWARVLSPGEVKALALADDRKPEPEIEAVLMGTEIDCACGCGVAIPVGQCAYRYVKHVLAVPPLYVSEEHARRAARFDAFMAENAYPPTDPVRERCALPDIPKVRPHPPYAAYTRFSQWAGEEDYRQHQEVCLKQPAPPKEPKIVYECSGYRGCSWTGSARDLSPKGRCPRCWHDVRVVEKGRS